jgi:HEAT repeat protein
MSFGLSSLPRTLDAALRDSGHEKFQVRLSALRDLGRLCAGPGRERAVAALRQALTEDPAPGARADAAILLADAGASECVPELLGRLRDEHERVRQMALIALGELAQPGDPAVLAALRGALTDERAALRFQALIALNRLLGSGAAKLLIDGTRDEDAEVRHVAFRLLEERWVGGEAKSVPAVVLQRARAALRDDHAAVRLAAAILLCRLGDAGAGAEIVSAVNGRERVAFPEDEQAAIELAGELELQAARPGLVARAFGTWGFSRHPLRWQARVALARLGDERAKRAILKGLRAWTRDDRTLAVAAAGHARLGEAKAVIRAMSRRPERADPRAVEEALALLEAVPGG